ncbi:MAG: carboxypeptidase-like regulatory domain-containing protein, partial [Candidatus Hodarchaeota archaeon]
MLLSKKRIELRYSFFFALVIILGFSFISFLNLMDPFISSPFTAFDSLSAGNNEQDRLDNSYNNPLFSLQPFQQPRILFIVGNPSALSSTYDIPFLDYMISVLNFNVTVHDDDNSYSYDDYDAIVISRTIGELGTVDSLANASIPVFTMECYNYDIFQLGSNRGYDAAYDKIFLLNINHFITQGFSLGYLDVYNNQYRLEFLENYDRIEEGVEIVSLAQRTSYKSQERTMAVLEKGNKAWDLSVAPERRAYWGAVEGNQLSSDGWALWNKTLHWILYDDVLGNASISVNVLDLDNQNVPNARVNLTDSLNASQTWSQNTTNDGYTSFVNIPFGYYNITIEFEDSINNTLSFLEIVGEQTYKLDPQFEFMVQVNEYVDNSPPVISNVHFAPNNNTGGNFSANVYDKSSLIAVNLSLTVRNVTNGEILRDKSFKMITEGDNYYYNDTALEGFQNKQINVTYNITAIDIAGNTEESDNCFFTLGDIIAPVIYEFNVTDHENGTLKFYANVSDDESLVSEVILRINDSFVTMHLNPSGLWSYVTNAYYGIVLNYSIYSATDSVGNENSTPNPEFGLVTPIDSVEPIIWGVGDTFSTHNNGHVEFTAYIKDWNDYQSGVNFSDVQIVIEKDGLSNTTFNMLVSGEEVFSFDYTFDYNDSIRYWITVSDLAGNINPGFQHGPFIINDNAIPEVTFGAKEFGNGTVEFNATVLDWPNNQTMVYLHYTQDYFGAWTNISMTNISNHFFVQQVSAFDYNRYEVWYYITATDQAFNSFTPSPDQYVKIDLTDKVSPEVLFTITNSSENDGEITVTAWAIDSYGRTPYINSTFHINFTTSEETLPFEMEYDNFNFHTFNYSFEYGEEVNILV